MQLYLFHRSDHELLDPNFSPCNHDYEGRIDEHAEYILNCALHTPDSVINVPATQLDHIASLHCDKWLEGTARHMDLYANALETPQLPQPTAHGTVYGKFKTIKYKSFSGDASGMIGEALFAFVLTEHFGLSEAGFAHFGASKSTGIFPDFGIHEISQKLQVAFDSHDIRGASLTQTLLILQK